MDVCGPVCAPVSGSRAVLLPRVEALGMLCQLIAPRPGTKPVLVGSGGPLCTLRPHSELLGSAEAGKLVSSSHIARSQPLLLSLLSGQFLRLLLSVGTHLRFLCDRSLFHSGPRAGGVALAVTLHAG